MLFWPISASVRFRQLPRASVGFHIRIYCSIETQLAHSTAAAARRFAFFATRRVASPPREIYNNLASLSLRCDYAAGGNCDINAPPLSRHLCWLRRCGGGGRFRRRNIVTRHRELLSRMRRMRAPRWRTRPRRQNRFARAPVRIRTFRTYAAGERRILKIQK